MDQIDALLRRRHHLDPDEEADFSVMSQADMLEMMTMVADILIQFLLEAVVLSLVGGVVGILLGVGVGKLVDMTGLINLVVTLDSIALAVGFSAAIGLFFGIYPANQAAGLNPIEALRYE